MAPNSKHDSKLTVAVDEQLKELAKDNSDHGEISEEVRDLLRVLAGEETDTEAYYKRRLKKLEEKAKEHDEDAEYHRTMMEKEIEAGNKVRESIGNVQQKLADIQDEKQSLDERIEEFLREEVEPSSIELEPSNLAVQNYASEVGLDVEEFVDRARNKAEEIEVEV